MKILITGASGFVGQALIESLPQDYKVSVSSRNYGSELAAVDSIANTYSILETDNEPYNAVIHLAGLAHDTSSKRKEADYFEVNEGLTKRIVDWINSSQKQSCKLIYLSSIKTYTEAELISEETPQKPDSVYGRSKLAAERYITEYLDERHAYYILQPVMIYGKGNKGNLPRLYHLFSKLPYPFAGFKNKRSILSINNLNYVISTLLTDNVSSGKYIVSDDEPVSTSDMLEALFAEGPVQLKSFALPKSLVKLILTFSKIFGIQTFQKVLGNLEVSNQGIKKALGVEVMPFQTKQELKKLHLWK